MAIEACARAEAATGAQQAEQANTADTQDTLSSMIGQVFERCDNAVFGVDAHGHVSYWNPRCADLLGLPTGPNMRAMHSSDLLCGGDRRCAENDCTSCPVYRNILNEEQVNDLDLTLCRADGTPVRVKVSSCYFYQDDDREISTCFTLGSPGPSDISD